jgi:hypothetical protein
MSAPSIAFCKQFSDTITLLAQQMDTRLRSAVMVDTNWVGEEKYYDQIASDSMVEITSRLQDTPIQTADHRRHRVTPRYFVTNTLEDPFEALAMLADPKSNYMQSKKAAIARKIDSIIFTALNGTAYTGKAGATSVTIASAQIVTHAAAGLTKAKILKAKRVLDASEVDKEDRFFVYTARQMEDLLGVTEVASSDYNAVKALVQGEVDTWCGFKFLHSEQVSATTATYRDCLAWQKKGGMLAIQKEAEGRLSERPDKNYAWQVYARIALGATRLEEERVVRVECYEAA